MSAILIALIGAAGVGVGSLTAWLVSRRLSSGSIDTSTAESLWAELRAYTDSLKDDVAAMHKAHDDCRTELAELRAECRAESLSLLTRITALEGKA